MLRFLPFIMFSTLGLALVAWGYRHLGEMELNRIKHGVEQVAEAQGVAIYARVTGGEEALETLPHLFEDDGGLGEAKFTRVARAFRKRHPEFRAVYWAPLVPAAEEDAFVARMRAGGRSGFAIHGGTGTPLTALPGANRFPVVWRAFEGEAGLEEGADLARLPLHAPYVVEARIRESLTLGAVQVSASGGDGESLFAYFPVQPHQNRGIPGLLVVEYDVDQLVRGARTTTLGSEGMGLVVLDRYAEPGHKVLHAEPPLEPSLEERLIAASESPLEGDVRFRLSVGGRPWELHLFPLSGEPSPWRLGPPWWVSGGLALLVLAFGAGLQWFVEGARAMRTLAGERGEHLARNEALMRGILQSAADAVITIDDQGRVQIFNEAAERMFGYASDEVIGHNVTMLMPESYSGEHDRYIHEHLSTGVRRVIGIGREVPARRKNGSLFPCHLNISRIEQGEQVLFTSIMRDITLEKQASTTLERSEQRFREFAEIASDWFWEMDAELRFTWMSERVTEVTGVPVAYHIGKTREDLAGEERTTEKWVQHFEDLKARRPFRNFGFWRVGHDGRRQYLITSGNPIFGENGEFLGYRGIGADHTGLHLAEEELQRSRNLLQAVFDALPGWVYVKDAESRYLMINRAMAEELGTTTEAFAGMPTEDIPHGTPELRRAILEEDARIIALEESVDKEIDVVLPDGRNTVRHVIKIPFYGEDGQVLGVVGTSEDITRRKYAEYELERHRNQLQAVFDILPVWMFIKDLKSRYVMINRALAEDLGTVPDAFVARAHMDSGLGTPEKLAADMRDDENLIANGGVLEKEERITLPSGRETIRQLLKIPYRDETGRVMGLVGMSADITGRKETERNLRISEEKFRDFAEVASDWFWEIDADLRFTWFSDKWEEVSGAPIDQLIGKKLSDLPTSEDEKEKWENFFQDLAAHRPFKDFAYWRKQPDGHWAYLSASGIPVYDDDGEFLGYRGVGRDLTQEQLAEDRLRSNEARFRGLVEGSVQGIAVHKDGAFLFVNQAYAEIYGYAGPEEVLALGAIVEMNVPEDREMLRKRGAARLRGEEPTPYYEMRGLRKDGTIIHLSSLNTVIDWDGEDAILTTLADITERKRAEEALRDTAHSLATAQAIAHLGSWEWNILSGELQWSDEIYRIFGLVPNQFQATYEAFMEAIHPEDRDKVQVAVRRALDHDEPYDVEHRVVRPDGTERYVVEQGELFRNEGGKPVRMLGTVHDITERRQIDIMKNEFISIVSHELRTPLTSILGSLGLIRGGAAGDVSGSMKQMLDIAHNNAERLVRLINDILDIEKIESGKMALRREPLILDEVVSLALEANRGYAGRFEVLLSLRKVADGVQVDGDADKLTQVLTNLISNAVKYSPQGGEVELTLGVEGGRARVEVRDEGPGIPEAFREQIFGKFAQADSTDSRQKGGTGLGLSISKAIVEMHGGTIGFHTKLDEGTRFFFTLPLRAEAAAKSGIGEGTTASGGPAVLVVEDDPDHAQVVRTILERVGFSVRVAAGVEEARQILAAQDFRAMTLDLRLPDGNGLDLLRELRAEEETRRLPVVVVSVDSPSGEEEPEGTGFELVDWMVKPIDGERLLESLRMGLRRARGEQRILYVEDDKDLHHQVETLLAAEAMVVPVSTLDAARSMLQREHFDLMVLDLGLPDGDGGTLIGELATTRNPGMPVIVFSAREPDAELAEKVTANLVKTRASLGLLVETIRNLT